MQHPFHLLPDMMVGPWRIKARLGAGGFGAVFRVEADGQEYALKFAVHGPDSADPNRTDARARRELSCLLLINHPHVVRVWAHGRWPDPSQGFLYVVMDYVEGLTLVDWAKQSQPTPRKVVRLFDTLALTLHALHSQGIHHRDLKGANILVRASDEAPVLVDFGAAEHLASASAAVPLTEGPLPPGTPHLRTPEALRFHREHYHDPNAHYAFQPTDDLYALGATLYEVLTGSPPFPPTLPRDVLISLIESKMPPSPATLNPGVPPALAELVLRLLAKRPEDRPSSGQALHEQFQALQTDSAPTWDVPLGPSSDAATTEGMGGKPLTFSVLNPEPPPPPPPAAAQQSPPSPPTVLPTVPLTVPPTVPPEEPALANRAPRWRWSMVALVLLTLLGAGLWSLADRAVAPSELPPPESPLTLLSADAGPPLHTRASTDAGSPGSTPLPEPPAVAQVPSPSPKEKGQSMRKKTFEKPPSVSQAQEPARDGGSSPPSLAAGLLATCLAGGCASTPLPPPPYQPCPPGSVEAMQKVMRITIPQSDEVFLPGYTKGDDYEDDDFVIIPEGPVVVTTNQVIWKNVPSGTKLYGELTLRDRLYGRFTMAELPNGRRVPFCGMLIEFYGHKRGLTLLPGSKPGAVKVFPLAYVSTHWTEH